MSTLKEFVEMMAEQTQEQMEIQRDIAPNDEWMRFLEGKLLAFRLVGAFLEGRGIRIGDCSSSGRFLIDWNLYVEPYLVGFTGVVMGSTGYLGVQEWEILEMQRRSSVFKDKWD